MEKRRPHHDLEAFKRVCGDPRTLAMTFVARRDASRLGFTTDGVALLVSGMRGSMFIKSMTSYDDHREWQDVYHVPLPDSRVVYLKFKADAISSFSILSFKER